MGSSLPTDPPGFKAFRDLIVELFVAAGIVAPLESGRRAATER
jgi:hypothetical protein